MLRPDTPRLLLLPTATYRTAAFVEAARRLGVDLTVASERPSTFQDANPRGLLTLHLSDPARAAAEARAFAQEHPLQGVVGVDDDTAVVAAAIAGGWVSYPCVLKPLRLAASRGVIRADTPEAFVAAFERVTRILRDAGCEM